MSLITCASCGATLLGQNFNTGALAPCPACRKPTRVDIFPALFRPIERGAARPSVAAETEASCFFHPQKRAAVACDGCGRFLCELCDLEVSGRHLCPNCLASGKKKRQWRELERERTLYDNLALALSTLPLLAWPFTLLTAPAALFVAIRYWKAPSSLIPRSKARFVIAILLALAQIAGWITLFVYLIFYKR